MLTSDRIGDYVERLRRRLPVGSRKAVRIVTEVESHLRENASKMQENGYSSEEAEVTAIENFGTVETVLKSMATEIPLTFVLWQIVRCGVTASILLSASMLLLSFLLSFVYHPLSGVGQGFTVIVTAIVFLNALLAWRIMWSDRVVGNGSLIALLATGLLLTGLGSSAAVWALHLGLSDGDIEYPFILRGLLLAAQGIGSVIVAFPWKVLDNENVAGQAKAPEN